MIRLMAMSILALIWMQPAQAQEKVIISEFMAANSRVLADRDREYSDWIELFNAGGTPVNLDGWFLTDSRANLKKWRFPAEGANQLVGVIHATPSVVNGFARANASRPQVTVTLPGSANKVPALTALREWVRNSVRTPNPPLTGLPNGSSAAIIQAGRTLFVQAGCANCHGGYDWTVTMKDFTSPFL